jgi:hypothetical protein
MVLFEVPAEGAAFTAWNRPAEILADGHDERMILVVQGSVRGKAAHEKRLHRVVGGVRPDKAVPFEDSAGVRVHDEGRHLSCVQENAVGRLRTDSGHRQKLLPQT